MSQQITLPLPPHNHTDTSIAAAQSMKPHVAGLRKAVLEVLDEWGPQTCDWMEMFLDLCHQTTSARVRELYQQGLIDDTGDRLPTRSGRKARVYAITARGREALRA